jgi:hypothetical protein
VRSGALALTLVLSAAVAVVAALSVRRMLPEEPPAPAGEDTARLEARVRGLEATVARLREDLARRNVAALPPVDPAPPEEATDAADATAAPGGADLRASPVLEPTDEERPEITSEEAAAVALAREVLDDRAREMAEKARRDARRGLERLAEGSPEDEETRRRQAEAAARRLAERLGLSEERRDLVATQLVDIDRRMRETLRSTIAAKGLDGITREDVAPVVAETFRERDRTLSRILDEEQLARFRAQERASREKYAIWLKMALPASR